MILLSLGYNGFPKGCSDDKLPWGKTSSNRAETKYMYVCHAEMNAILNKNAAEVKNCSMYVALFPCNECAKMIIQSGRVLVCNKIFWPRPHLSRFKKLQMTAVFNQVTKKFERLVCQPLLSNIFKRLVYLIIELLFLNKVVK